MKNKLKEHNITSKLVDEYIEKHQHTPSRTLARIIADNMAEDASLELIDNIRSAIRYRRIAKGQELAEKRIRSGKQVFINPANIEEFTILDEPDGHELQQYDIPAGHNRLGWLSDIHIPKHDNAVIDTALNDFAVRGVNCIVLGGDVLDNPQFSKFAFRPSYTSRTGEWLDQAEHFIEQLRYTFPGALILFLEGNHDAWYRRYLWQQAKAFGNDPYYDLQSRLGLIEHNVKWIPETQLVRYGDYYLFHGHQHAKGGQLDTAAKRLLNRLKSNCIVGHMHYASMFQEIGMNDIPLATVHISGAASTKYPSYMPFGGKSRHGYINVDLVDGKCEVENVWLDRGKRKVVTV